MSQRSAGVKMRKTRAADAREVPPGARAQESRAVRDGRRRRRERRRARRGTGGRGGAKTTLETLYQRQPTTIGNVSKYFSTFTQWYCASM